MRRTLIGILLLVLFVGCKMTPDGVLDESDFVSLMVDMHKAEAYMDMNQGKFYNDSLKMAVKQSVLMQHGVTQEEYDSTLVWYGHNVDRYTNAYDKIIEKLTAEQKNIKDSSNQAEMMTASNITSSRKRYSAKGDTADLWNKPRTWQLIGALGKNIITFDYPAIDLKKGDQFKLSLKLCNTKSSMKMYFGIDYTDGSTAFVTRESSFEGWNNYVLQSDSTKNIRRIYGYMQYSPMPREIAYIDSVELLRMHLDRNNYSIIYSQKWFGKKRLKTKPIEKHLDGAFGVLPKDPEAKMQEGSFTPKPGLNKSSASEHVQNSPNMRHMSPPSR